MQQRYVLGILVFVALFTITVIRGHFDHREISWMRWWERPMYFLVSGGGVVLIAVAIWLMSDHVNKIDSWVNTVATLFAYGLIYLGFNAVFRAGLLIINDADQVRG